MKSAFASLLSGTLLQSFVLSCAFMSAGAQADGPVVGWVEKPDFSAFRIIRGSAELSAGTADLQACDVVKLLDDRATVQIMLANYQRVRLDAKVAGGKIQVPCGEQPTWYGKPLAVLRVIAGLATAPAAGSASPERVLATRSEDASPRLAVPALGNYDPMLVAGERSLYLTWEGGIPPYSVTVLRHGSGTKVVEQHDIGTTFVRLPRVRLEPGRYVLEVLGSDKYGIKDDTITVVDAARLPAQPTALSDAKLPQADHELLYAYYLEGWGKGEWTLEALQRAAAIDPATPAAREWLRRRFSQATKTP